MNRYIISLPASRDLRAIIDYFAVANIDVGERLLQVFNQKCQQQVFNQKCQQLVSFPNMGQRYDNLRPGLRGIPLDGYIILYQLVDDGIEIVRVVSGKQNLESLFTDPQK